MGTAGVPQKSACQMGIVAKQGGGSVPLAIGDAGRDRWFARTLKRRQVLT